MIHKVLVIYRGKRTFIFVFKFWHTLFAVHDDACKRLGHFKTI